METRKEFNDETRAALAERSPIDNSKAKAFAEEFGFTVHQVRAVAVRSDDIEYVSQTRKRKDGSDVELKSAIVGDIADALETDAETVESLGKATRNVLIMVRDALSN